MRFAGLQYLKIIIINGESKFVIHSLVLIRTVERRRNDESPPKRLEPPFKCEFSCISNVYRSVPRRLKSRFRPLVGGSSSDNAIETHISVCTQVYQKSHTNVRCAMLHSIGPEICLNNISITWAGHVEIEPTINRVMKVK